jgi:hypothetical protein
LNGVPAVRAARLAAAGASLSVKVERAQGLRLDAAMLLRAVGEGLGASTQAQPLLEA